MLVTSTPNNKLVDNVATDGDRDHVMADLTKHLQ